MEKSFPEGFLNYLKSLGYSENTCLSYVKDIELYYKEMDSNQNEMFNLENLSAYFIKLGKQKLSAATLERKKASLVCYGTYLNIVNQNHEINIKNLVSPKKPKKIPHHLLLNEVNQLIDKIDKSSPLEHRNYLILLLFYSTGMRLSELLSLKPGQINVKDRSLKIMGKGRKERIVFLPVSVLKEYCEYLRRFDKEILEKNRVFLNFHGNPLTPRGVEYIFEQMGNKSGLDKRLHPHIFRHTFATQVLENGADIRKVGEFLGHSSLNTTQKYTHLNRKKLKETLTQFHPHA